MPAPSKSFTVIPDGDIDPDSPITTGLMTKFRDNDVHLEEWLGLSFTAAQDHNHDGTNSASVTFDQDVGSGQSYNVVDPDNSSDLWVDMHGFATRDQDATGGVDTGYAISASITFDLSAFTMTGVGRIVAIDHTGTTLPTGVVTDHAATAIADNVFVTVVTILSSTLQIRYNQSTDVFDIQSILGGAGTGGATDVGMRVLEI